MTAYNIIGESPLSSPVEVFVGEAGKVIVRGGEICDIAELVYFPV